MKKIPPAVASYYASVPATHKANLLEIRERILAIIPEAEEVMKYGMPTFLINGQAVAGLLANKNHIGYYPYGGSILGGLPEISAKYRCTKGALHLPIAKPPLKGEIRALINASLRRNRNK